MPTFSAAVGTDHALCLTVTLDEPSGLTHLVYQQESQNPVFCVTLLRYLAGGLPSAFLNMVMKAVTDS